MNTQGKKSFYVAATAVGVALAVVVGPSANAATAPTVVTVAANQVLSTVGGGAVGVNDWQNDATIATPATAGLLRSDGVRIRELNAGPYDDVYRWRTNTFDHDPVTDAFGAVAPVSWQSWVAATKREGAQAMVHVNYGSTATDGPGGTDIGPQEAAAWVRQANIVDHDDIKYWLIGEEVWGNGFFAPALPAFEPDHHADKTPAAYGRNVVKFAQAMKAVDPTIRIGVELTPFPSGTGLPDWNNPLLAAAGSSVDFVDVHSYDFGDTDDAGLFNFPAGIPATMRGIRDEVDANLGAKASTVQVIVGETNASATDPGTQSVTMPSALYAADDVTTWLEQGAADVNWFDSHHPATADTTASPDDPDGTGYGTWAMLSDGSKACSTNAKGQRVCEPPLNTPFPSYYGFGMAAHLATPGAELVRTTGASAQVVTHAAVQRDGSLVVLVENEDPNAAHDVSLDYAGFRPVPVRFAVTYGGGRLSTSLARSDSVHLAPFSMTELRLLPA
jgi:hypothetical protein